MRQQSLNWAQEDFLKGSDESSVIEADIQGKAAKFEGDRGVIRTVKSHKQF